MSEENKNEMANPSTPNPEETAPEPPTEAKPKKKRWLRILYWIIGVIAVLLIMAIIARDAIIKVAVNKVGTAVTGTKVEMDSFSSSLGGTVELSGFRVGNPEGYQNPNAFQVDHIKVSVNIGSLLSDEIEVREVLITGTKLDLEMKINGKNNLNEINQNVKSFSGSSGEQSKKPEQTEKPEPKETQKSDGKKVVIRLVKVEGTEISVSSSLLKTSVPLPLPPITLKDLGGGKNLGETISEFTNKMLEAIMAAISDANFNLDGLKEINDSLNKAGSDLSDSLKQGGQSLKDVGKNLEENFKGLLKNKK